MSLKTKNYVASLADVEALTRAVLDAARSGSTARASYLKALIATTQHELGAAPRQRQAMAQGRLSTSEKTRQLAKLERVHERFYAQVCAVARESLEQSKDAAIELNRRTNFARSAMSTIRRWIQVGNDLTALVVSRVTKRSLQVESRKRRAPSVRVLTNQIHRHAERFKAVTATLAVADTQAALTEWEALRAEIDALFEKSVKKTTRRSDGARDSGRSAARPNLS